MVEPFYHLYRVFSKVNNNATGDPQDEVASTPNYSNAYELACYYFEKYDCADVIYELHEREITRPIDSGTVVFEKKVLSFKVTEKEHHNE